LTGRDIVVLGAGRSGTSLVAGLVASGGHFVGSKLLRASKLNPRGFFEDVEVNRINEHLLTQHTDGTWFRRHATAGTKFGEGQRWLAALPPDARFVVSPRTSFRMRRAIGAGDPFCLKDPRFCYTLDAWGKHLRGARAVCVFRQPGRTAVSMLKAVEVDRGLRGFDLSRDGALHVWRCAYESALLKADRGDRDWLFLHYDSLFEAEGVDRLEAFVGTTLDRTFVDPAMRRSVDEPVDEETTALYRRLCERARRALD
jgi:hypothetical protein